MIDLTQLREALDAWQQQMDAGEMVVFCDIAIIDAAKEILTIREAGALIITPDETTVERIVQEMLKMRAAPHAERGIDLIRSTARKILDALKVDE